MKDFEILNKLNEGSFGTVYRVRRNVDKKIYAIRQLKAYPTTSIFEAPDFNELKILSSLENPSLVKCYDVFAENEFFYIVMEFCEGGNLASYIKGQSLSELQIWKLLIQICIGLRSLHQKKILHTHIKSSNIFLCKEDEIRIGDLGVAKAMSKPSDFAHCMVTIPYDLSPEIRQLKRYNEKSDIWALGCVLYEMCTQKRPSEANNLAAMVFRILKRKFEPIPSRYSSEITEIIEACLCPDHHKRPSADDLLNKPALIDKARELNINLGSGAKPMNEVIKTHLIKTTIPCKERKAESGGQVQKNPVIKNAKNKVPPRFQEGTTKPALGRDVKTK